MAVTSKAFQSLMLTSMRSMFQPEKFHMLLGFVFNQMFTLAKIPLDYYNFQLLRLGGTGVLIQLILLEPSPMVLRAMKRCEMTNKSPLVEELLNLLFLTQVLYKYSSLSEWQQG